MWPTENRLPWATQQNSGLTRQWPLCVCWGKMSTCVWKALLQSYSSVQQWIDFCVGPQTVCFFAFGARWHDEYLPRGLTHDWNPYSWMSHTTGIKSFCVDYLLIVRRRCTLMTYLLVYTRHSRMHDWAIISLSCSRVRFVSTHERCKGERWKSNASRIIQEFPSERSILKLLCLVCKESARKSKPTQAQVCVLNGLQRDFIPLRLKLSFPTELVISADTGASWALRLWPSVLNNVQLQTCGGRLAPKNLTTPWW